MSASIESFNESVCFCGDAVLIRSLIDSSGKQRHGPLHHHISLFYVAELYDLKVLVGLMDDVSSSAVDIAMDALDLLLQVPKFFCYLYFEIFLGFFIPTILKQISTVFFHFRTHFLFNHFFISGLLRKTICARKEKRSRYSHS